jgi:spermidine/putrescine transport system permease protein
VRRAWPYLLLAPGLAWLVVFFAVPSLNQFYVSLQEGNPEEGFAFAWNWSTYGDSISAYSDQFLRSFW